MNDSIRWVLSRAATVAAVAALAVPAATATGSTSTADYKLLEDGQVVDAPH